MTNFTPILPLLHVWTSLLGGAAIGASASLLLVFEGRVAGISGIVSGVFGARFRPLFLGGLLAGGVLMALLRPSSFGGPVVSLPLVIVAGLLVGAGTKLGGGCTSGHGVCGIARLSVRSIVATLTFMATGIVTAVALERLR